MKNAAVLKSFDASLDCATAALSSFFLLLFLSIAALVWEMTGGQTGARSLLLLTAKPLGGLALAAGLLSLRALDAGRGRWSVRLLRFSICGALFASAGIGPSVAILLGAAATAWALSRRGPAGTGVLPISAWVPGLAAISVALSFWPCGDKARINALGLISGPVNSTQVDDPSRYPNKDSYPVCRYAYNSLGFRDAQPSFAVQAGKKRVLVVGDSFVWGDGIPTNEETLGALLRARLEFSRPGRFVVMSAAYHGLGVYGYDRFIDAVAPEFRPDVVVVGYLGYTDHDPFDSQFLADHLPSGFPLRNLILNMGALQGLHEASIRHPSVWSRLSGAEAFEGLYRDFARKAAQGRYRLIFLSYASRPDLPPGIEVLDLPQGLRYQMHSSDLWYAKDYHPKPQLNLILADMLAARIATESYNHEGPVGRR